MKQGAACKGLRCQLGLHHSHSWQPYLPTTMGFFQPGTRRGMFSMTMGSLKTVPFRMFLQAGGSMSWGGGSCNTDGVHIEAIEGPGQQGFKRHGRQASMQCCLAAPTSSAES